MLLRTTTFRMSMAASLMVMASGCAGPLIVSAAQSRGDDVKFAYTRAGSGQQGIVDCKVPASGDIQECRHMKINFQE